jgi:hypothetical protein
VALKQVRTLYNICNRIIHAGPISPVSLNVVAVHIPHHYRLSK